MRASRLLRILLILQNRGRTTAARLAAELEVAPRTILRDVDALGEAGLPIVVHPGFGGGIELGFEYRTRLTGLLPDEARAIGVLLASPPPELQTLGLAEAARRAATKLLESLPDGVRQHATQGAQQFRIERAPDPTPDPRIPALATAIRDRRIVRLDTHSPTPRQVHPQGLTLTPSGWQLHVQQTPCTIPQAAWGVVNISARQFPAGTPGN
jgi:predicted DNA-binding transcriptional regulator YafY